MRKQKRRSENTSSFPSDSKGEKKKGIVMTTKSAKSKRGKSPAETSARERERDGGMTPSSSSDLLCLFSPPPFLSYPFAALLGFTIFSSSLFSPTFIRAAAAAAAAAAAGPPSAARLSQAEEKRGKRTGFAGAIIALFLFHLREKKSFSLFEGRGKKERALAAAAALLAPGKGGRGRNTTFCSRREGGMKA